MGLVVLPSQSLLCLGSTGVEVLHHEVYLSYEMTLEHHSRWDGFSGEMFGPDAASCHSSGLVADDLGWYKTKVGSSPGFETQLVLRVNDEVHC